MRFTSEDKRRSYDDVNYRVFREDDGDYVFVKSLCRKWIYYWLHG